MSFLFFDVETTGLPKNYKAPYTDLENWPRIVQCSWLLADDKGGVIKESDNIIKVDFPIPPEVSKIHGITNELAQKEGKPLLTVLENLLTDLKTCNLLVCHNINFDLTILKAELLRLKLDPEKVTTKTFCTMKNTTNYCKLPGPYGFKWPTLEELYRVCFSKKIQNAHNAMEDVRATYQIYFELKNKNVF